MPVITVHDNEPLEKAIRRFKRKCERSGVLREVRMRPGTVYREYQKVRTEERLKRLIGAVFFG